MCMANDFVTKMSGRDLPAESRKLPPVSVKLDDSLFIESLDNPKPVITLAELSTHTLATDCWIAIDGRVFDVTKWLTCHPGGAMCLMSVAGRDVTDIFHSLHPVLVQKQMRHIWVGVLPSEEVKPSQLLKDYRQLYQDMIDAGMFVTDPGFYVWLGLRVASLLVASICCVLLGSSAWIRVGLGAPLLAAFWQQLAFVGHDMGHSAITHNRRLDHRIGVYLGNALGGISIGWWKDSHFFHHVVTNSVSHDPDIQHAPFMAVDATFLPGQHNDGKPLWSFYHSRFMHFGGVIAGFLIRNQATLFYPLLMVARFFLYIQSFLFTLGLGEFDPNAAPGRRRAGISHRRIEIFTLLAFWGWFGSLIAFGPFSSLYERLGFLLLSHALAGILHVQITLSHYSMEVYNGIRYNIADDDNEFEEHHSLKHSAAVAKTKNSTLELSDPGSWIWVQLDTTLDVTCPRWMDWFHGGLQFQGEHHLWPRMPRKSLRRCSEMLQEFCKSHGLPYHSAPFLTANWMTVQALKNASAAARRGEGGVTSFQESILHDSLFLIG